MKKTRLIDIAKEANVSVATVSYVLNKTPNQRINEDTRIKIEQIAALHNYKKNNAASLLAKGQTKTIGIYVGKYDFALINSHLLELCYKIITRFNEENYTVILLTSNYTTNINYVDAILTLGLSDEDFITVSKSNVIPVIAIECKRHIPWTFEICRVYKDIKSTLLLDDYVLLTFKYHSKELNKLVSQFNPKTIYVSNFLQLENLINEIKDKKIVVTSNSLLSYLSAKGILSYRDTVNMSNFINVIINSTILAIEHREVSEHVFHF